MKLRVLGAVGRGQCVHGGEKLMRVRQMVAGEVRIVLALQAIEYVHVANRKDEVVVGSLRMTPVTFQRGVGSSFCHRRKQPMNRADRQQRVSAGGKTERPRPTGSGKLAQASMAKMST